MTYKEIASSTHAFCMDLHLYRRLTLTLQWGLANPLMFSTSPRIEILVFLQNISYHLTSDTATHPEEQQECYSKSHQNAKYYIDDSSFW